MARFRGTVQGSRGVASRLGTAKSGLDVTCNGWDAGVTVIAGVDGDSDVFTVLESGGSKGHRVSRAVARITYRDGKVHVHHYMPVGGTDTHT